MEEKGEKTFGKCQIPELSKLGPGKLTPRAYLTSISASLPTVSEKCEDINVFYAEASIFM